MTACVSVILACRGVLACMQEGNVWTFSLYVSNPHAVSNLILCSIWLPGNHLQTCDITENSYSFSLRKFRVKEEKKKKTLFTFHTTSPLVVFLQKTDLGIIVLKKEEEIQLTYFVSEWNGNRINDIHNPSYVYRWTGSKCNRVVCELEMFSTKNYCPWRHLS